MNTEYFKNNNESTRKNLFLYLFFFCFTFIIRFPYFFISKINWDESTFILMGRDIPHGHMPLTNLWDIKAPFLFLPYSLFLFFFGESVFAVRFGVVFWTSLSAMFSAGPSWISVIWTRTRTGRLWTGRQGAQKAMSRTCRRASTPTTSAKQRTFPSRRSTPAISTSW